MTETGLGLYLFPEIDSALCHRRSHLYVFQPPTASRHHLSALAKVRIWLHSIHMTSPQVSQVNDEPDYTKVRGWLLFFGLYAGYGVLTGVYGLFVPQSVHRGFAQSLPATVAKVYVMTQYFGYLMLLVHLAQCVAIFRRLRIGRTLSLMANGLVTLHGLIWLPFIGALVEATTSSSSPSGIQPANMVVLAYVGVLISLASSVLAFLYFLRSERVKQTLVN
jgi:uncharacterized membrane protein